MSKWKDDMFDCWKSFRDPMKQAISNTKDNFSDTASDAAADMRSFLKNCSDEQKRQKYLDARKELEQKGIFPSDYDRILHSYQAVSTQYNAVIQQRLAFLDNLIKTGDPQTTKLAKKLRGATPLLSGLIGFLIGLVLLFILTPLGFVVLIASILAIVLALKKDDDATKKMIALHPEFEPISQATSELYKQKSDLEFIYNKIKVVRKFEQQYR